ncbi:CDP-alcohol phosphatidyltransferase family protein [Lutibacter sp.]
MKFKKHIPNLFTLCNLLSGTIAVIFAVNNELLIAGVFVFIGILFDFFDGFIARILNVQGELGKQLDSLADMVTSGVVPGIVMFKLLQFNLGNFELTRESINYLPFVGLLITLAAGYRLANFNIDARQTNAFVGIPTPAAALTILSLPLILHFQPESYIAELIHNNWFLIVITLLVSYLMNAELMLFALKFKHYKWKGNEIKYVFIILTLLLLIWLHFVSIPIIITLYVLLSIIENYKKKGSKV